MFSLSGCTLEGAGLSNPPVSLGMCMCPSPYINIKISKGDKMGYFKLTKSEWHSVIFWSIGIFLLLVIIGG